MPRLDRRIEDIDRDEDVLIVSLAPGYACLDANTPNACHTFSARNLSHIRERLKVEVTRCSCAECRSLAAQ